MLTDTSAGIQDSGADTSLFTAKRKIAVVEVEYQGGWKEPPGHKAPTLNYHGQEETGIKPIGIQELLRRAKQEKITYYTSCKSPWEYGLIMFSYAVKSKQKQDAIAKIYEHYPVTNGGRDMCMITLEYNNLRGITVIGDVSDVVRFWCDLSQRCTSGGMMRIFDSAKSALCWSGFGDGAYFPYLDFDELSPSPNDFSRVFGSRVKPAIDIVASVIREQCPDFSYFLLFSCRPAIQTDGHLLFKYSFHVHFPTCVVDDITTFKKFLAVQAGAPRQRKWTLKAPNSRNPEYIVTNETAVIYDLSVYGGSSQLMRGPYCGKKNEQLARLVPIVVVEDNQMWAYQEIEQKTDDMKIYILSSRIRARLGETGVTMIDFRTHEMQADSMQIKQVVPGSSLSTRVGNGVAHEAVGGEVNGAHTDKDILSVYTFMQPLIYSEVIPLFQEHKNRVRKSLHNNAASTPTGDDIVILFDRPSPSDPLVRFIQLAGDTYCFTDPSHYHSKATNVVSLSINLHDCSIWQHCFACGEDSVHFQWLHTGNVIEIHEYRESQFRCTPFIAPSTSTHEFLARYYRDCLVYHRERGVVFVYDSNLCCWLSGVAGNVCMGSMMDELNKRYRRYLHARQLLCPDGDDAKSRKFITKNTTLLTLTPMLRGKLLSDLRLYPLTIKVGEMNPHFYLYPMSDRRTFNVFTGTTQAIRKDDYITSLLNCRLVEDDDESIDIIEAWYSEVACGVAEKATYMKWISAYCLGFGMHDRKFFVGNGTGKNAKGTHKGLIMRCADGAAGTDPVWKAVNQSYWAVVANASTNAESASPETFQLLDKTFLYTDDMARVKIDTPKLKRIVAGEPASARALYGSPITVNPRTKVFWTTNFEMDIDGKDNAAWERFSIIDYGAKYVENDCDVDHAKWRFKANRTRYEEILGKSDAFFTVSVKALHLYYSSLKCDATTGHPLCLGSFPVSHEMTLRKRDARARQLPLANFMKLHTGKTAEPIEMITTSQLFDNYLLFLDNNNERKLRTTTTKMLFQDELMSSLEIRCVGDHVEFVKMTSFPAKPTTHMQDFGNFGDK